ncbi:MAG: type II toxin-antitoxin system PemK/MazF family toxin [Deltaproteobacteria bacterium]|nr:type II toxin-antitoxin system PemK/MazF family toxin [Deltaproteobacteria bacterium]
MPSTTVCRRGEIVLVRFVFADEGGAKRRPALVLSTDEYNSGRADVIVAALTSNVSRLLPGDYLIVRWQDAGLPKPSVATAIVRTIKASMVERPLGKLDRRDMARFSDGLKPLLGW